MDDVIIEKFFPPFLKMAELDNILPGWANEM